MKKKFIVGLILIALTSNFTVGNVKAFTYGEKDSREVLSTNNIKVSKFSYYDSESLNSYNNMFKVDRSNIKTITNNGGQYSNSGINNAIDDNMNTFWETGTPNSDTFKNEVIVEFNDILEIDRMVYATRQDGSKGKGFPLSFEIYGSTSEGEDDFTLIGTGVYETATGDVMEFKFNKTNVKRIKFKFINANQNWASAAEFWFYKEDKLANSINEMFTDSTLTKLTDDYNNIEVIDELEALAANHPMKEYFVDKIEIAKELVNNNNSANISNIKIKSFALRDYDELPDYNTIYKRNVKSISNNGGQYGSQNISKAIDGDLSTHWETGTPNSNNFKNEVVVTFDKIEGINRIVYATRQDGAKGKGFPLEFEIYSSLSEVGDTFKLVGKGITTEASGDLMEFNLENEVQFKRLKIKFINAKDQWASASELWFYGEDLLIDKVNDIFANGLYTEVKEKYKDLIKLEELRTEVNGHPLSERFNELIDMAINIVNGTNVVNGILMTPTRYGDMMKYTREEQLHGMSTNIQPTGVYGVPGDRVKVYVDVKEGEPLPKIVFSQIEGHFGNWFREYTLSPGVNEIIVPNIYDESWVEKNKKGGPIYIINPYTEEEQTIAPKVRIEGGTKYPIYYDNGNEEEFIEFLRDYKAKLDSDTSDGKVLNLVEIVTDSVILTGTAVGAYEAYIDRGIKPEETTDFWVDTMNEIFRFYGMDNNGESHKNEHIRESIRLMQPFGYMYAAGGHVGVQRDVMTKMLVPDEVRKEPWGFIHELGHKLDQGVKTWGEVTNNVIANHMLQYFNGTSADRVPYKSLVYPKVVSDDEKIDFNSGDFFERLGMFWQLEVLDDNYWSKLNRMYIDKKPNGDIDEQGKRDIFIEYSSEILGVNLTEFFTRHGFAPSEEVKERLKTYEDTGKKYWYLNSSARYYKGAGIENTEAKIDRAEVNRSGSNASITLSLGTNANDSDILGYEIYRNGVKIAFTNDPTYEDKNLLAGESYSYEVIAYGRDLSTSNVSNSIEKNTSEPIIYGDSGRSISINSNFNPLENIKAINSNGEDITSRIEILYNNVNTSVIGEYKVKYSVTDLNNITSTKEVSINVINDFDYVSDLNWKTATVGWGTIGKDKSIDNRPITLNRYGNDTTYTKGLGTHSNSTIIYDISDKNYDFFESYIGVDREVSLTSPASVTFEVWVDGEKKYDSGVITASSYAKYVKVPVKGANEVKLVVTDSGNGNASDHADWADAKFVYNSSYLSDLNWSSATIGWGTVKKDKSVENGKITLQSESGNVEFEKGIGTHSPSVITYDISNLNYRKFESFIGIDKEVPGTTSDGVRFKVFLDGVEAYDSGIVHYNTPAKKININIQGKSELKLVVEEVGHDWEDHADWADAKLSF